MEWLASTTGALQQLGCHRLIRSYCQGLPADTRQGVQQLSFTNSMATRHMQHASLVYPSVLHMFPTSTDARAHMKNLTVDADVAEVQAECAWRLGDWDADGQLNQQLGAVDAANLGDHQNVHAFHGAVRSCLQALSSGQHDRWSTILSSARTVRA
jgi:hypothetical protein